MILTFACLSCILVLQSLPLLLTRRGKFRSTSIGLLTWKGNSKARTRTSLLTPTTLHLWWWPTLKPTVKKNKKMNWQKYMAWTFIRSLYFSFLSLSFVNICISSYWSSESPFACPSSLPITSGNHLAQAVAPRRPHVHLARQTHSEPCSSRARPLLGGSARAGELEAIAEPRDLRFAAGSPNGICVHLDACMCVSVWIGVYVYMLGEATSSCVLLHYEFILFRFWPVAQRWRDNKGTAHHFSFCSCATSWCRCTS